MAMVEVQTTAALAESRRKMQARRRLKNRIALTLSMATMAFGLFWRKCYLVRTFFRGVYYIRRCFCAFLLVIALGVSDAYFYHDLWLTQAII